MTDANERPAAEDIVLYDKNVATKIATITIDRPDKHNAITTAARHRFSDLVHRANVDDDVKVLVIRGAGDHFGTGDELPGNGGFIFRQSRRFPGFTISGSTTAPA